METETGKVEARDRPCIAAIEIDEHINVNEVIWRMKDIPNTSPEAVHPSREINLLLKCKLCYKSSRPIDSISPIAGSCYICYRAKVRSS